MTHTAFGLPVQGDVIKPSNRPNVEQKPLSELEPSLRALLERDDVEAIRWTQYVPYFNDGDICEFGVGDVYIKLKGVAEDGGDYEDGFLYGWDAQLKGGPNQRYDYGTRQYVNLGDPFPRHPAYDQFDSFSTLFNSGAFHDALYDAFGDHAQITVTRDKVTVEEYSHD